LALGYAHPDHLLAKLTSRQVSEWWAYDTLEPFGERVDWLRMGVLAATIVNCTPRKKGSKAAKPEDFIPPEVRTPKVGHKQSVNDMKSLLMAMAKPKPDKPAKRKRNG
jgi:hypothetical protein